MNRFKVFIILLSILTILILSVSCKSTQTASCEGYVYEYTDSLYMSYEHIHYNDSCYEFPADTLVVTTRIIIPHTH